MEKFKFIETKILDLYIIEPMVFKDNRGYFFESYNKNDFFKAGLDMNFVQENESFSTKGVLRGLHYQRKRSQGKLVRCIKGEIFDVAVDLRFDSPTYKEWVGEYLSDQNKRQLYIPEGFAHGFLVTSEYAVISYKCTDFYAPDYEEGILWNDLDIGISWPKINTEYILSEKDRNLKELINIE